MSESLELEQLSDLIEAFPANYSKDDLKDALNVLKTRYDVLDNVVLPELMESLELASEAITVDTYINMCKAFHKILFKDVISIAGEFRSSDHPSNGSVYFGGQKRQELTVQFSGSPPDHITEDLQTAFEFITVDTPDNPLENALRFYQKFVFTHPFYDGNGRIARLFVNLYLGWFEQFIDWKNLQKQNKFLKKLNYYHNTGIDEHFSWWMKLCNKYVYQISDEDERNE